MFTQDFMLNRIYVKGEVSNCKYHTSGHIYFSLKDESGMIACIMFAGQRGGLPFRMREGPVSYTHLDVYKRQGCISSIADGSQMLLRIIFTTGVLFLLTIAVVTATTMAG